MIFFFTLLTPVHAEALQAREAGCILNEAFPRIPHVPATNVHAKEEHINFSCIRAADDSRIKALDLNKESSCPLMKESAEHDRRVRKWRKSKQNPAGSQERVILSCQPSGGTQGAADPRRTPLPPPKSL